MIQAIGLNNINEVRRLLDAGEDASSCMVYNDRDEPQGQKDTLHFCMSPFWPRPEMARFLIERGAHFTSPESKAKFDADIYFMVDYGRLSFEEYMPVLRVFAENGFMSPQLIKKV